MTRIGETEQELTVAWNILQNDWEQLRELWRDKVAESFEREWWNELEDEIPSLIHSVSELEQILRQAEIILAN